MKRRSTLRAAVLAGAALATGLLTAALPATSAHASGAFHERDGAALRGHDAVAYFTEGKPVKGSAEHAVEYQGSRFLFASPAHRAAFVADPARYAPQYGGYCAFGTAAGYKAAIDPTAFTVVDGKLYLNYSRAVQQQWSADIPGFIAKADRQWPAVRKLAKVHE